MKKYENKIFNHTSEDMHELPSKSVDLVVTSPPYNINIQYGNKTSQGKVVESKGVKYEDNKSEDAYKELLRKVFAESIRVLKDDGSLWINIKNKYENGVIIPPFWIQDLVP